MEPAFGELPADELEVFDNVGKVDLAPINTCRGEGRVEHLAGGADKWVTGAIFLVSRLFSHKHQPCRARPLAEHGLVCIAIQLTAPTTLHRLTKHGERRMGGE